MGTGGQSSRSKTFVDDSDTISAAFLNTWLQDGLISLTGDVRTLETSYDVEHYSSGGSNGKHRNVTLTNLIHRDTEGTDHEWETTNDTALDPSHPTLRRVGPSSGARIQEYRGSTKHVEEDEDGDVSRLGLYKYLAAKSFTERIPVATWSPENHSTAGEEWDFEEDHLWHANQGGGTTGQLVIPIPVPVGAELSEVQIRYHLNNDGIDAATLTTKLWHRTVSGGTTQVATDEGDTYTLLPATTDETDWREQTPSSAPTATADSEFFVTVTVGGAYSIVTGVEIMAAKRTIATVYAQPGAADA